MFNFIKRLKRYKLNKEHVGLVLEAWKGEPFDYGYLLGIEEKKLREMLVYHKQRSIVPLIKEQRDEIIRTLELACKLIHIIRNDSDLFHYDVSTPDVEQFVKSGKTASGNDLYESNPMYKCEYVCDCKVNMRNAGRFCKKDDIDFYRKHRHELYIIKARHLYHMIRERYECTWWD